MDSQEEFKELKKDDILNYYCEFDEDQEQAQLINEKLKDETLNSKLYLSTTNVADDKKKLAD